MRWTKFHRRKPREWDDKHRLVGTWDDVTDGIMLLAVFYWLIFNWTIPVFLLVILGFIIKWGARPILDWFLTRRDIV